jgi:hypothetical protein
MFEWTSIIYLLCLVTSAICAALLVRSYARHKSPLLLWSAICFVFLALNNLIVVVDLVLLPEVDLSVARSATVLVGIFALIYGFIWEVD